MSCCPPNAWKFLAPDYNFVGKTDVFASGLEYYVTGSTSSKKALLLIPDIYGWNGGRTRNVADYFADEGYYVVVPKLLTPPIEGGTDGDGFASFSGMEELIAGLKKFPYEGNLQLKVETVVDHFKTIGIEKYSVVGFCWGGWVACHLLSSPAAESCVACAIPHPSVSLELFAWGRDILALFKTVKRPILLMPAKGDPDEYREKGEWYLNLRANNPTSESLDFPEEDHGFVPRGDISIPQTKAAVDLALGKMVEYLNSHF